MRRPCGNARVGGGARGCSYNACNSCTRSMRRHSKYGDGRAAIHEWLVQREQDPEAQQQRLVRGNGEGAERPWEGRAVAVQLTSRCHYLSRGYKAVHTRHAHGARAAPACRCVEANGVCAQADTETGLQLAQLATSLHTTASHTTM